MASPLIKRSASDIPLSVSGNSSHSDTGFKCSGQRPYPG
jgi:hypothetical protein